MKKQNFNVTFLALVSGLALSAQIQQPRNDSFNELLFFVNTNEKKYSQTEGSPYLNDEFLPARINNIQETKLVRFNAVDNVIEIKQGEKILGLSMAKAYTLSLLDGSGRIFEIQPVPDETGKMEKVFLEKVHSNQNYVLFKRENIRYTEAKPAKSSYEQAVPAKFLRGKNRFYLFQKGLQPQRTILLPNRKKEFLQTFGEKGKILGKVLKKEGLKLTETQDLVKLFDYYYEL